MDALDALEPLGRTLSESVPIVPWRGGYITAEQAASLERISRPRRRRFNCSSETILSRLALRDGPNCYLCDRAPNRPTIDHWLPLSLGGSNNMQNLFIACHRCNNAKGNAHPFYIMAVVFWRLNRNKGR